jgi:uracil-DNA glycosylase
MPATFDPGICHEPFAALCEQAPDQSVFPSASFRVEWGPIFYRGRLDGTARILCIGQDPAQNEAVVRRILIGVAGHRVQGFLGKLGIDRSYVMLNTFLYSVYDQNTAKNHVNDPAIADYRNRWFSALIASGSLEAVVSFGSLADSGASSRRSRGLSPHFPISTCGIRLRRNRPVVHRRGSKSLLRQC